MKINQISIEYKGRKTYDGENVNLNGTSTIDISHPAYIISIPSSITDMGNGGTYTLDIKTEDSWAITQKPEWATITPMSGKGNGNVQIEIPRNNNAERSGELIIYNLRGTAANIYIRQLGTEPVQPNNEIWYRMTTEGEHYEYSDSILTSDKPDKVAPHYAAYNTVFKDYFYSTNYAAFNDNGTITSSSYNSNTGYAVWTLTNPATRVAPDSFRNCRNLKEIYLPDSVTEIGEFAFGDTTTGVTANGLEKIVMSDNVTTIGAGAFQRCRLTSIRMPSSLTEISNAVLKDCYYLTTIDNVPATITEIGRNAFYGCEKLLTINYNGTMAQWQNISKGTTWNFRVPSYCIVHCSDGDVRI